MGLFDKILKSVTNAVTDTIKENIENNTKEVFGNSNNEKKNSDYSVPEKYSMFPKYSGMIQGKPVETKGTNYTRVTMTFNGTPSEEFRNLLETNGFVKSTEVRYDKMNTYVIVENMGSSTKIVYHIKN